MRRIASLATAALCASLACTSLIGAPAGAHAGSQPVSSGPATLKDRLRALHVDLATRDIVDDRDRQVTLRGVNVNSLGDYYQGNPSLPTVVPVTGADWDAMAAHGFNVVRLLVSWSRLEPKPGVIDHGYLRRVERTVDAAAARGIYSVIDMHQDAWGKFIATPPGTTCPPGTGSAIGWDGAPQWATLTDGADTCRSGGREETPAVRAAWDSFYTDRAGIQTHLVRVWEVIARHFAGNRAVAAYDLLNEANHGNRADYADRLANYYSRAIDAIRTGERRVASQRKASFPHIAIFETTVYGIPVPSGFSSDTNLVLGAHNYGDSITPLPVEVIFDYFESLAVVYRVPLWIGEYGWFGDPVTDQAALARYAAKEDALLTAGGAWWQWRQACGDPHTVGTIGAPVSGLVLQFLANDCPGDINRGVIQERACTWRPYPRAVPGRLTSRVSGCDGTLDFAGSTSRPGWAEVWYPGQTELTVTGATGPVRRHRVPGGVLLSVRVEGNYRVSIVPAPVPPSARANARIASDS